MRAGDQIDLFRYTIYLLHFDKPVSRCRHYLGLTGVNNLNARLARHARGRGANLTRRAVEAGIGFTCVRTWPANLASSERRLKKAGHYNKLCPLCTTGIDLIGPAPVHVKPNAPVFSSGWKPADWTATSMSDGDPLNRKGPAAS